MKNYVLYNPLAGGGKCKEKIKSIISEENTVFCDLTEISDYPQFLKEVPETDIITICGGDGTLNCFINSIEGIEIKNKILYLAAGSGNDFLKDIEKYIGEFVEIEKYIEDLPVLEVNGQKLRFINGIGYGLDGYCCQEGNRLREKNKKKINYTAIALKALLFKFKPLKATVWLDGKKFLYDRVWMATTMKGRFFGGGMKVTPNQDRFDSENKVTLLVAHNLSKFRIITLFPSIFKGNHIKYVKYIATHQAHEIKVKFDRATPLQIDGESISNVIEYAVTSKKKVKA